MVGIRGKLGRVVEDITTLEINTILCDGMTGEQMADPRQALFDLGYEYIEALRGLVPGFVPPPRSQGAEPICGSREVFAHLHRAARDALVAPPAGLGRQDRALVTRIKVKSGQLVALFDRLRQGADPAAAIDNELCRADINGSAGRPAPPPLPLAQDDLIQLRKIWELSTDTIAMQTVITLGGDVVSRMQRDLVTDENAVLLRVHADGIKIALSSWGAMIKALGEFVGSLLR